MIRNLGTGAAADGSQVGMFTIKSAHLRDKPGVAVSIEGLGAAETADLWYLAGGEWVPATEGGTQVQFDENVGVKVIQGAGTFGFTKTATTANPTVRIELG